MPTGTKKLRPCVQGSSLWLKNYVKFFFVAQSALPIGWIKLRRSIDQLPFYVVILVLVTKIPHMCWKGGWVFSSVSEWKCVGIKSLLKSVTAQPCVCVYILIFICNYRPIDNMVRLTVICWQWTRIISTIAARGWRWFLIIFHDFLIVPANFNFKTWHTFVRNFDCVSVDYLPKWVLIWKAFVNQF